MRSKLGTICMCLGAALVLAALSLFAWNRWEDARAGAAADKALSQLAAQIGTAPGEGAIAPDGTPAVEIDGYGYAGILSLPTLGLELPVMAQWDYERLKLAPCVYDGTAAGSLVIAGHNYTRHFGRLDKLNPGDAVYFTAPDGTASAYEVEDTELLPAAAVEEMTGSGYDLTLFTCDYSGQARIAVRCGRADG